MQGFIMFAMFIVGAMATGKDEGKGGKAVVTGGGGFSPTQLLGAALLARNHNQDDDFPHRHPILRQRPVALVHQACRYVWNAFPVAGPTVQLYSTCQTGLPLTNGLGQNLDCNPSLGVQCPLNYQCVYSTNGFHACCEVPTTGQLLFPTYSAVTVFPGTARLYQTVECD
jgi:hypothetical protein